MSLKQDALEYHTNPPGKLEVVPTKPTLTQRDLSLAYSPGVAEPCKEIYQDSEKVFHYTNRGNLVAVITNGTAVLGLGDIGPLAGKPVMEGKAVLFKRFADIDVFDIEVGTKDPQAFIHAVELLEPTFGGINLEDIKAPECFLIEETLRRKMNIPVFHDDQHGTAIISGAALLNALEVVGKDIEKVKIAFNGAGAASIATARFYLELGARRENIILCDSKGVVYRGRKEGMEPYRAAFATSKKARTLAQALEGADVFVGLSVGGAVSAPMLKQMEKHPIVFALANPDPEIDYDLAKATRPDAVVATGRSDYPNQVNNVLGFPFIFRGALDVRAREINEPMKIAAAKALAALAHEDVPDAVVKAYGVPSLSFGPDYLIPKALDPRVLLWVTPAVAKAAMDSGVATRAVELESYRAQLEARLGKSRQLMQIMTNKARSAPKRLVFPEGENVKIIRAAHQLAEEGIAHPVLLGRQHVVEQKTKEMRLAPGGVEVVDPDASPKREAYAQRLYQLRQRKGLTLNEAKERILDRDYFASVMLEQGDVDAMVSGLSFHYPEALRPPLQVIGTAREQHIAAGVYLITLKKRNLFFADATVNIDPTAEELAEIALLAAGLARRFEVTPRIAMLSFSNFGSVRHPRADKVRRAVALLREQHPDLVVDGEMQADSAVVGEILQNTYPMSDLKQAANVLIFPSLEAGNIAYKLLQRLADAEVVGPILVGLAKPVHVLQRGDDVKDIVNLATLAVVEAQENEQARLAAKPAKKRTSSKR